MEVAKLFAKNWHYFFDFHKKMDSDALLLIFPGPTSKYGSALEKCLYNNHHS